MGYLSLQFDWPKNYNKILITFLFKNYHSNFLCFYLWSDDSYLMSELKGLRE